MITKQQVFAAMNELGVIRAVADFSGGNDEGGVNSVALYRTGDENEQPERLDAYEYSSWGDETKKATPQGMIVQGLEGPVDGKYGSFAGEFYVNGTVTADLAAGTLEMSGEEEVSHPESFSESW